MNGRVMGAPNAAKGLCVADLALAAPLLSGLWVCRVLMRIRKAPGQIAIHVARAAQVARVRTRWEDPAMIGVDNAEGQIRPRHW